MQCLPAWRAIRRGAPVFVCALFAATPSARAADEFAVNEAQIKSLGITLQKLQQPAAIEGQIYPARVVLPAAREQVVSAPLAGLVDRLLVGENDAVKSGQPLLHLISPELGELQLKLLEASSKSKLSAKASQRERQLFAEGIIPERRVHEADADAEADKARLVQAEAALRLMGLDAASIKAIGSGGPLRAGLTVYAKAAGTVLGIDIKPGQRVSQADALMRLADTRSLWIDIEIPADRRAQVSAKAGEITIVGRDASATTMSLGSVVSESQALILRAQITKGAERLRPGEYVQAKVPFAASSSGAAGWPVPVQSVVRQGDKAYVFVRTPTGFVAQPVTVLNSAGTAVQVQGSLSAGQEIATGSVIALKAAWLGKGGGE